MYLLVAANKTKCCICVFDLVLVITLIAHLDSTQCYCYKNTNCVVFLFGAMNLAVGAF